MSKKAGKLRVFQVPAFQHVPLEEPDKAIRLLSLEPGWPIKGSSQQYSFPECPPYEAVSYRCDSGQKNNPASINNQTFHVRDNLLAFLRQFHQRRNRLMLWCDAICIDQNGNIERNHQVRLMGRIYEQASSVLVWLPDEGV